MMKRLLSFLPLLLFVLSMSAAPIHNERAKEIARQFLNAQRVHKRHLVTSVSPERLSVKPLFEGKLLAVNNGGEGFVILSGDDCSEVVLGYSDKGSFDLESAPEQVKGWLQDYARQQEAVAAGKAFVVKHMAGERAVIEPKLTTQWNQDEPYNNMCVMEYDNGTSAQCVAGCVAVAMAQVLKYHEWPEAAVPEIKSYHPWSNTIMQTLPSIVFDWENMRVNAFTGSESEEQLNAVAQLVRYCGQSVHMQYSTTGSSAVLEDVVPALSKYFGYDESARCVYRRNYSVNGWESLIYDELDQNGPVLYSGSSTGGGHSFVVDGYDGAGYFHVNWGWGGLCDGYYLLTTMDPDSNEGIGASSTSDGYSIEQNAIVGVQKKDADAENNSSAVEIHDFEYEKGIYTLKFDNLTGRTQEIAFVLTDMEGNIQNVLLASELSDGCWIALTVKEATVLADLPDGTYRLAGASRVGGQTIWKLCEGNQLSFVEFSVEKGSVVSRTIHPIMDCKLTNVDNRGDGLSGHFQDLYVTFTNTGTDDSYTTVDMYVGDSSEQECSAGVSIPAGGSTCAKFSYLALQLGKVTLTFKSGDTLLGTYTLNIADSGANLDSWFVTCKVNNMETMGDDVTNVLWSNDCNFTLEIVNPTNQTMTKTLNITVQIDGRVYPIGSFSLQMPPKGKYSTPCIVGGLGSYPMFDIIVTDEKSENLMSPLTIVSGHGGKAVNAAGYKTYIPNGSVVPDDATSVDFTYVGNEVVGLGITPSQNPNCLYFLTEDSSVPSWLAGKNVVRGMTCSNLELTDGFDFRPKADFTAAKASYTRSMSPKWGTIMLPFEVQSDEKVAYFLPKSIEDGLLHLTQLTTLPANTPALVAKVSGEAFTCRAENVEVSAIEGNSSEVDGISLHGFYTNNHTINSASAYMLRDNHQFEESSDFIVNAFRAYLTLDQENTWPTFLPILDEFNSFVQDIADKDAKVVGYYDVAGHRIANLQKGINLVRMSNGKTLKIMVE